MRRLKPQRKYPITKRKQSKAGFFGADFGNSRLKTSKPNRKSGLRVSKKSISFLLVFGALIFSLNSFLKVNSYNEELISIVNRVDDSCKEYKSNKNLNSVLVLNLKENSNEFNSLNYWVYDNEKVLNLDFNQTVFDIDKGFTKGTFKDYFSRNNVYMDEKSLFINLSNLFLKEFKLKVDHLIVTIGSLSLEKYIDQTKVNISTKILQGSNNDSHLTIQTDICKNSWNNFILNVQNKDRVSEAYTEKKKLSEYFFLGNIKKEQQRIHINNATGVENWGIFVQELYSNYGLNVVKIDVSNKVRTDTTISLEDESLKDSASFDQISYLAEQTLDKSSYVNVRKNIYADIYIEMGEDWLIR